MKDIEIRNFGLSVIEIRGQDGESDVPVIAGEAAVYNQRSLDLGGFVEEIEPGFFEGVLDGDTRGLFNHDRNFVLGRTRSGTLTLDDRAEGLGFRAVGPWGQTIHDLVIGPMKRGDIDQCSFAFSVRDGGDAWREEHDGTWVRTLKRGGCKELFDVSVVTDPAYPQTSAAVRSRFEMLRNQVPGTSEVPGVEDGADGEEIPVEDSPDAETGKAEDPAIKAKLRAKKIEVLKARVR